MNPQYEQLKVKQGEYIPQPALDYPTDNPFERTLFPKQIKNIEFDEYGHPRYDLYVNNTFVGEC